MKIVFVCNFPGPSNALYPVIKKLSVDNNVIVFGRSKFFQVNLDRILFYDVKNFLSRRYVRKIFDYLKPDLIVTGTTDIYDSETGYFELMFVEAAKLMKIKVVSYIDHWVSRVSRFYDSQKKKYISPDVICVNDQVAKNSFIAEGYDPNNIFITGNPAWDSLKEKKYYLLKEKKHIAHKYAMKNIDCKVITFISSPFIEDGMSDLGYSEYQVLKLLLDVLIAIFGPHGFILCILIHPRESELKYADFFEAYNIKVKFYKLGFDQKHDFFAFSDYVLGMTSMLLVEFALLGAKTASIQLQSQKTPVDLGDKL